MALTPNTLVHNVDGDNLVVESGGAITVKSGGSLTVQSGGSIDLDAATINLPDAVRFPTSLAVGGALPTNPQAQFSLAPAANASGVTANQSYYHGSIIPGGAVTIPTGTAPIVASLNIAEPNITATGTVTAAATVRIADAPTEGGLNYALWVDAGATRLDGGLDVAAAAHTVTVIANTTAAYALSDGTTNLILCDTRNTIANVNGVTISSPATTIATAAATHENPSLKLAAKTITYTGTNTVTSQLGAMLNVGVLTLTDASAGTVSLASAVHINAVAAAGGSLTLTAARMISTSVTDCYLTNAGVWTDTSCWKSGKKRVGKGLKKTKAAIDKVLDAIQPATWKYKAEVHGDDQDRDRVGILYDDLPQELRAPGQDTGVSAGVLSSFALAALKVLRADNRRLEARLAKLEAAV